MLAKVRLIKSILIVISLLLLLNGCGINYKAKEKGYIYKSDSEAIFINWTEDKDHKIVGQLQITELTNSGVESRNHSINGVLNDNKISITISGSILNDSNSGKVFTGTLDGASNLSLLLPASNGMMNSLDFIVGTVEDFNIAVKALTDKNSKIQADKKENAQKADQLATQQGIIKSLAGIDKKIKEDTSDLANTTYTEILGQYDETLQRMNKHYAKLKSDGSVQPLTGVQKGIVETDLGTLQVDLGTLETVGGSMEVRNNDIQTAKDFKKILITTTHYGRATKTSVVKVVVLLLMINPHPSLTLKPKFQKLLKHRSLFKLKKIATIIKQKIFIVLLNPLSTD